jgi:hypothetical protein
MGGATLIVLCAPKMKKEGCMRGREADLLAVPFRKCKRFFVRELGALQPNTSKHAKRKTWLIPDLVLVARCQYFLRAGGNPGLC